MLQTDVIVIGAGPGCSMIAAALARIGHPVLLVGRRRVVAND